MCGRWFPGRSPLALWTLLPESLDVVVHPGPKEPLSQLYQGVVGPEVAAERTALGQVHQGPSLGAKDDQEVTRLASALHPKVEQAVGQYKVFGWEMLPWWIVNAVNQLHPAVPQSVIFLLIAPEVPLLSDLVEHRGDWVRGSECLT